MADEGAHVRKHLTRAHDIMSGAVRRREAMTAMIDAALKLRDENTSPAPAPPPAKGKP